MAYRRLQKGTKAEDLVVGERYAMCDLHRIKGWFFYLGDTVIAEEDDLERDSGILCDMSTGIPRSWKLDGDHMILSTRRKADPNV